MSKLITGDFGGSTLSGLPSSGAVFSGILDSLGLTAKLAYGFRRLRTAYAGSCFRVRRVSDNVELDIGFVNNVADWASAITFMGGSSLTMVLFYDQSGTGINFDPLAVGRQPVVDTTNKLINFDGVDDLLRATAVDLSGTNAISFFWAGKYDALTASTCAVDITDVGATNFSQIILDGTGLIAVNTQTATGGTNNKTGTSDTTARVYNSVCNRANAGVTDTRFFFNAAEQLATTSATDISGNFPAGSLVSLAEHVGGSIGDISAYEFILFASAVSDPNRATAVSNMQAFYGL